jgi:dTMP kinase
LTVLQQLETWVQGDMSGSAQDLLQPDLTLWFDLPPAQAAQRLSEARAPDRFEARGEDFFARVRDGYAARAARAVQRFVRIDATAGRADVWRQVEQAIHARGYLA